MFLRGFVQQPGYERLVACRILKARQTGGKLHVKEVLRQAIDGVEAEFHFAAGRVYDSFVIALNDGLPKRPHVGHDQGVDDRQALRRADLDKAEFGPIGMLGDKFRIQGNPGSTGQMLAKLSQVAIRSDALVLHAAAIGSQFLRNSYNKSSLLSGDPFG